MHWILYNIVHRIFECTFQYCFGHFIYSWWCSLFEAICCSIHSIADAAATAQHSFCITAVVDALQKPFALANNNNNNRKKEQKQNKKNKNLNEKRAIHAGLPFTLPWLLQLLFAVSYLNFKHSYSETHTFHSNMVVELKYWRMFSRFQQYPVFHPNI